MEILREKRMIRFECRSCGCVFVCSEEEVYVYRAKFYKIGNYWEYACPRCGKCVASEREYYKQEGREGGGKQ